MKKIFLIFYLLFLITVPLSAGIYNPEGLNMPGGWNGWTNPPTNALALASATQVASGKVALISTGTARYHTTIKVAASGGDAVGGTYEWLFTSGSTGNPWGNKWGSVSVSMNTLQAYTKEGSNNSITVTDGKWYTVNWQDNDYTNTQAIFMETSGEPVTITMVTDNYSLPNTDVTVSINISTSKSTEERIFVRYTTDGWSTSSFVEASGSSTSYSAVIPAAAVLGNQNNQYYVLTTTVSSPTNADVDMFTINYTNNSGFNYILPIQLASFIGNFVGNNVKLEWQTISETNNYGFNVQRLNEVSNNFETIGFVAGKGTTLEPQLYSYIDDQPGNSYRLEQIDNNGLKNYFGPIYLNPNSVGENVPAVFKLNQNYPNPFNPTTNIKFSLGKSGYTSLKVYNILGKEVEILFSGNAEAGKQYVVNFDAKNLTSGIYFYKLQTGNSVEVKKLTLVK